MRKKYLAILVGSVLMATSYSPAASAAWNFGIGTGPSQLNVDGDLGWHTALGVPIEAEVELDPDDISDLTESALGFGGYATNGKWMFQYSLGKLELEGDSYSNGIYSEIGFDITSGEIIAGYPLLKKNIVELGVLAGTRYTKHEFESEITNGSVFLNNDFDHDWVDAVLGVTANLQLHEKWSWNNRVDAGFGGSEGTYTVNSGITWRFFEHWSATVFGKYAAVEYENDDRGDRDWYLYDVDETTVGLTILFNW